MKSKFVSSPICLGIRRALSVAVLLMLAGVISASVIPNLLPFLDPTGFIATYNNSGKIDTSAKTNPFFENLGTNGRNCGTCHIAANGMGLGTDNIQERFHRTSGRDPLFADFDGANCPNSPRPDDPLAHSLLLSAGLIRIPIALAATPQFQIKAVHDPYGCAVTTDPISGATTISVYRRPLPTTNLRFLSAIMLDGRESSALPLNNEATFMNNLVADLKQQAVDATTGHAQALTPPTDAQQTAIVNFELGLFSSQIVDSRAGVLDDGGAYGGPSKLAQQTYYPGMNDSLGADPSGDAFNPAAMTLFDPWTNSSMASRKDIAAGQAIFNSLPLTITSVRGLNDNAALGKPASITGNCTTCHDTPNVGNHSTSLPLDLGLTTAALRTPDMPLYTFRNKTTGEVVQTTDPGRALITGQWKHMSVFKGPILRGLATRAPYFHNGFAGTLAEVVEFYDSRFNIGLTPKEKSDLAAFLKAL